MEGIFRKAVWRKYVTIAVLYKEVNDEDIEEWILEENFDLLMPKLKGWKTFGIDDVRRKRQETICSLRCNP